MVILLTVIGILLVVAMFRMALPSLRRWRMAAELRGDWWSRFERDLRAWERQGRMTAPNGGS